MKLIKFNMNFKYYFFIFISASAIDKDGKHKGFKDHFAHALSTIEDAIKKNGNTVKLLVIPPIIMLFLFSIIFVIENFF